MARVKAFLSAAVRPCSRHQRSSAVRPSTSEAVVSTRRAAGCGGHPASEVVGAAEVAGEERDGKAAPFIADDDGRIMIFVAQQRSNGADHDAGGHDADDAAIVRPHLGHHRGQPSLAGKEVSVELPGQLPPQRTAAAAQREHGQRRFFPGPSRHQRYSWEKEAS
jgi:hypothetical protein